MVFSELIFIYFLIFLLVLLQIAALTPLSQVQIHPTFILVISPGFLLITASFTYYFSSIITISGPEYLIFFVIAVLFFEFIVFFILVKILKKRLISLCRYPDTRIPRNHIFFLLSLSFLISIFFINLYPPSFIIFFSGDGVALKKLVEDLASYGQQLFSYTYYDSDTEAIVKGLFYPWAGFILSAIFLKNFELSSINSLIVPVYFFSLFAYPFIIYLILKILRVPFLKSILFLLVFVNLFPIGLIFTNNFATIFAVLAALVLLCLFLLLNTLLFTHEKIIFIFLSILILIPLHPSAVFSFIFFLIVTQLLFSANTIKWISLQKFLNLTFIMFAILTSIVYIFYSDLKVLWSAFLEAQPNYFSWEIFIKESSLLERILPFAWQNIITLSYYSYSIPSGLFILIIIIYSKIKFKKNNYYMVPFILYFTLISASSVSGITNFFDFISIISLPFYQSPIRIAHLGVYVYVLYIALFLKDLQKKKLSLEVL